MKCYFSVVLNPSCLTADAEGRERVDPAGLPAGGRAADGAPAPTHRALLWRVHGRRATGHGVRVHETRRPEPLPSVRRNPRIHAPPLHHLFVLTLLRPFKIKLMKSCNNRTGRAPSRRCLSIGALRGLQPPFLSFWTLNDGDI